MKYLLLFVLIIGLLSPLRAQKKLPATEIKTLDGQPVTILDYVGEQPLTILSFWATWCINCKKELNAIADLYPDWREDFGLQLIAVTIDDQRSLHKARPVVETSGWEYIILSDTNRKLMNALNFRAIPQTFVLDREGNILYEHTGYAPGAEYDLEDFLRGVEKE